MFHFWRFPSASRTNAPLRVPTSTLTPLIDDSYPVEPPTLRRGGRTRDLPMVDRNHGKSTRGGEIISPPKQLGRASLLVLNATAVARPRPGEDIAKTVVSFVAGVFV